MTGISSPVRTLVVLARRPAVLAIVDQALYAGSNFLLQIAIARSVSTTEFGAYAVASVLYFFVALTHQTLLIEPMFVYSGRRYSDRIGHYYSKLRKGWSINAGLIAAVALAVTAIPFYVLGNVALANSLLAFSFTAPFLLYFWLLRRMAFVSGRIDISVVGGTVYTVALLVYIGGLIVFGFFSAWSGVIASGLAAITAALSIHVLIHWPSPENAEIDDMFKRHIEYGRWSFAAELVNWVIQNTPSLLLPFWFGLSAAGSFRVVTLLFMPLYQVVSALGSVLLRRFAAIAHTGSDTKTLQLFGGLFGVGALYSLVILALGPAGLQALFGPHYMVGRDILLVAGVLSCLLVSSQAFFVYLRAIERSGDVLKVHLVVLCCTLLATPAGLPWGLVGVIGAQAISWFIGMLVALRLVKIREKQIAAVAAAGLGS